MSRGFDDNTSTIKLSPRLKRNRFDAAPRRSTALFRLGGRHVYLDANNATLTNYLLDYIKYKNYQDDQPYYPLEETEEIVRFSKQGIFQASGAENTHALLEEVASLLNRPFRVLHLKTRSEAGDFTLDLGEGQGGGDTRAELMRIVSEPGIVVIHESDIARDQELLEEEGGELNPEDAEIYRNGLKREIVENKHPETLVFFVTDWQNAGDIEAQFERSHIAQITTHSAAESTHIIRETERIISKAEWIASEVKDEEGKLISAERFGVDMPDPTLTLKDSGFQVLHLHSSDNSSPLPLEEIVQTVQEQDGTSLVIAGRDLSDQEIDFIRSNTDQLHRAIIVSHPTEEYGSVWGGKKIKHINY